MTYARARTALFCLSFLAASGRIVAQAAADPPTAAAAAAPRPHLLPRIATPPSDPPNEGRTGRPTDQAVVRWLEEAHRLVDATRLSAAMPLVQKVFDQVSESYIRDGDGQWRTARRSTEGWLAELGPEVLNEYRRQFQDEAADELRLAIAAGDDDRLARVAKRFFLTPAGFQALNLLASEQLDRGRVALAAAYLERLLENPARPDGLDDVLRVKQALALAALGRTAAAQESLAGVKASTVSVGGSSESPARILSQTPTVERKPTPVKDWRLFEGDARRSGFVVGGLPLLAGERTDCARPLTQRDSLGVQLDLLLHYNRTRGRPTQFGVQPLAIGGVVYCRMFHSVVAVDLAAGKSPWPAPYSDGEFIDQQSPHFDEWQGRSRGPSAAAFEALLPGNTIHGTLSADDERLYLIDQLLVNPATVPAFGFGVREEEDSLRRSCNRLTALDLATGKPRWRTGGRPSSKEGESNPLAGVFFLGPPLPLDGKLYILAETKSEIQLLALDPATGGVEWRQSLVLVDRRIDGDPIRRSQCSPLAGADGILLCPTNVQRVVAFDLVTRTPLWDRRLNEDAAESFLRFQLAELSLSPDRLFPVEAPIVAFDRVVYSGPGLQSLHCLDLQTGRNLWKVDRGRDAFLAGVVAGNVLLVGADYVRGLRLTDGKEVWRTGTPTPGGRGVRLGDHYLLPLVDGEVVALDAASGARVGTSSPPDSPGRALGNLLIHQNRLVAVGRDGLRVFPLLDDIRREAGGLLAEKPNDPRGLYLAATLSLAEGRPDEAVDRLLQSLSAAGGKARHEGSLALLLRIAAEPTIRNPATMAKIIESLRGIVQSPSEKGVLLRLEAERSLAIRDVRAALLAAEQHAELDLKQMIVRSPAQVERDATAWQHALVQRATASLSAEDAASVEREIVERLRPRLAVEKLELVRSWAGMYGEWRIGKSAWATIGRRSLAGRELAVAEQAFAAALGGDAETQSAAYEGLAEVAELGKLPADALEFLEQWERDPCSASDPNLAQRVRQARNDLTEGAEAQAVDSFAPAVQRARLSIAPNHRTSFEWLRPTAASGSFLRNHAIGFENRNERLVFLDCKSGKTEPWEMRLELPAPTTLRPGPQTETPAVGRIVFVTQGHRVAAVSVLERRPLWTRRSRISETVEPAAEAVFDANDSFDGPDDGPQTSIGPAGVGFLVVRYGRQLSVVDPLTGEDRWRRRDLTSAADRVFGDGEVLFVVNDRGEYVVHRTRDGEVLRTGNWAGFAAAAEKSRQVGRRLLLLEDAKEGAVLRLWDPWHGKDQWNHRFSPGAQAFHGGTGEELAVLERSGRLTALDRETGREILSAELGVQDAPITFLRVFRDSERLYVILPSRARPSLAAYGLVHNLAAVPVHGSLRAYRLADQSFLWSTQMENARLLRWPSDQLPVLLCLRATQHDDAVVRRVEVLDKCTGKTLAGVDVPSEIHFFTDLTFSAAAKQISLLAWNQKIVVKLIDDPAP